MQGNRIGLRGEVATYCVFGLLALAVLVYAFVKFVASVSDANDLSSIDSVNFIVVAVGATVGIAEIASAIMRSSEDVD